MLLLIQFFIKNFRLLTIPKVEEVNLHLDENIASKMKLYSKIIIDMKTKNWKTITYQLEKYGFSSILDKQVLWNYHEKIVIKQSYIYGGGKGYNPTSAIPTILIENCEKLSCKILIQPMADISYEAIDEVFQILEEKVKQDEKDNNVIFDYHDGNIGIWNGNAVMIDW